MTEQKMVVEENKPMTLFDLTGKIALVTGATKGIGQGIADQLAAHGAHVIITGRNLVDADRVASKINEQRGNGEAVAKGAAFDINTFDDAERLAKSAREAWGGLDILVCNAAELPFIGASKATPPDMFDQLLATNIHHNFRLCQAVRGDIAARGGGAIILIGSVAGHTATPMTMAYGIAKAGLAHMARSLADELAPERIRVNCVAPGLTRSFTSGMVWRDPTRLQVAEAAVPLGRIGEPEDVAGAVIFLASKGGSYVTGTTIFVDGGRGFLAPPGRVTHLSGLSAAAKDAK
jgi:NAD(P)-dependent dehydrogenase (short-subunit alcohol dehydrogenase family)